MTERQWFTAGMFGITAIMLGMAYLDPRLWDVKLFEVILQAIVLTGLLNLAGAFHFAATKGDEAKTENTKAAFKAIEAAAKGPSSVDATIVNAADNPVHVEETNP